MPIIITPKDFDHWLQLKTEDVSSTEVSALFGISPYSTEFELWHQKASGEVFTLEDNDRMYCGRMLEETIAKMVCEQLEIEAMPLKTYFRHSTCPRLSSSFDYEITDIPFGSGLHRMNPNLKGMGLLEIKNVDSLIYRNEWTDDEAPAHIEAQVQHQMEVADRGWTLIAALVGGNNMKLILRERDRDVGEAICSRVTEFWESVDNGEAPMPNFDQDAGFIMKMHTDDAGEPINISDDEDLKALVVAYKALRDRYNQIEKATDAIKAEVLYLVGNASALVSNDGLTVNLKLTKSTMPTIITEDMVGDEIGGRSGWRQFRITQKKKFDPEEITNNVRKPDDLIINDEDILI